MADLPAIHRWGAAVLPTRHPRTMNNTPRAPFVSYNLRAWQAGPSGHSWDGHKKYAQDGYELRREALRSESLKGKYCKPTKTRVPRGAHTPDVVFWPRSNRTAAMRDGAVPAFLTSPACALGCTLTAPLPFGLYGDKLNCSAAALFSTSSRGTTRSTCTKWKDPSHCCNTAQVSAR